MVNKKRIYERNSIVSIEEVLSNVAPLKSNNKKVYNNCPVRMDSLRYHVFKEKGIVCVNCGLHATYFALERSVSQDTKFYHFNLYGITVDEEEVLFTKDHIIPKSLGGKDHLDNLQTMCSTCNWLKGNTVE